MRRSTIPTPAARPAPAARRLPLAVLGAGAALVLTACGADGGEAPEAWSQARTQLEEADSVRMVTELTTDSGVADTARMPDSTDTSGPLSGGQLRYVSEFHDRPYTTVQETRVVDGTAYSRLTVDELGGVSGEETPTYEEKWTAADARSVLGDGENAGMGALVGSLLEALPPSDALEGQEVEADTTRSTGHDAVRYELAAPVAGATPGTRMTAFTVAQDDGELLTVETESAGVGAITTFSEWNAVEPVAAPPAEDVVQQNGAQGGGTPGGTAQDGSVPTG